MKEGKMSPLKIEIKKELSVSEFDQIISSFKEELRNNTDIESLTRAFNIYIKEITPAKHISLLQLSSPSELITIHNGKTITIDISNSKGMLAQCIKTEEPQFTNDIKRHPSYEEKTDNIFDYELKNLLLFPLFDINNKIFAVLWAGIPKGDINQYIAQDIEHIKTLCEQITYVVPVENNKTETPSIPEPEAVQETPSKEVAAVEKDTKPSQKKEEIKSKQLKESSPKDNAPKLVKKIKSLFSRTKKSN